MGVSLSGLAQGREVEMEDLNGRTVAIDASNTLYQFLSIIRDRFTGEPLRNSRGEVTSHLSGLFYRTSRLLEAGIRPIFVFDGRPPEFKRDTTEGRKEIRAEAERRWKEALEAGDVEAVRTYAQGAARLTPPMVEQSKRLLDLMGIGWVQAPSEGEAQAAFMASQGTAWAAGSQDWDSLLFGSPRMVKNLSISGRRKVPRKQRYVVVRPEVVELRDVLAGLGMTREQLIVLGILIGTDYNPGGVKGVGPKTALKMVREHGTLEAVMRQVEWGFGITPERIMDFFLHPPVEDSPVRNAQLRPEELRAFMVEEQEFTAERVDPVIEKLRKGRGKSSQRGLGQFM
jgi:flap endonuclease-1